MVFFFCTDECHRRLRDRDMTVANKADNGKDKYDGKQRQDGDANYFEKFVPIHLALQKRETDLMAVRGSRINFVAVICLLYTSDAADEL